MVIGLIACVASALLIGEFIAAGRGPDDGWPPDPVVDRETFERLRAKASRRRVESASQSAACVEDVQSGLAHDQITRETRMKHKNKTLTRVVSRW